MDAIANFAQARPHAPAVSSDALVLTFAELDHAVEEAARSLQASFPDLQAPVAIMLDNCPAWVVLDLALVRLGWPSVPLPVFFTDAQRAHALRDAGVGLIISDPIGGEPQLLVAGRTLGLARLDTARTALPAGTAKVTYTSGSTGAPKGVCLSQDQMEAVAFSLVEVIGRENAGRHLPLLPLAVLLENVAGLYVSLIAASCYHVMPAADLGLADPFSPRPGALVNAIQVSGATSLILVPELLRVLLMAMGMSGAQFPKLNFVAVGGAKISPRLLAQAHHLGLPVFEGYGLSECASVVALNTPRASRPGTVGRPLPHLRVEVSGAGEIIVGPRPFLGYTGEEAHQGAVSTGDLGEIDNEGFLRLQGRRGATIINAFGRNIAPEWVESELLAQPEIRQALVFGEGQQTLGALIAPLVPHPPPEAIAKAVERANQALPDYARVKRWLILLPFTAEAGEMTGNGRLRRSTLLARHHAFINSQEEEASHELL